MDLNLLTGNYRSTRITSTVQENSLDRTLYFAAPDCNSYEPGQFLMVWIPGVDEIPISVSSIRDNTIGLTVRPIGPATTALVALEPSSWLGIRGPFGRPFFTDAKRPLIVGGGIGMAPLRPLVYRFLENNIPVSIVISAKTSNELLFVKEISELSSNDVNLEITTDDGSLGIKGLAPIAVEQILSDYDIDTIFTCGPEMMMVSLWRLAQQHGVNFQASLERYMKCGCGICGTCAVDSLGLLVCQDGPIFDGEQLSTISEFGKYYRDSTGVKHSF